MALEKKRMHKVKASDSRLTEDMELKHEVEKLRRDLDRAEKDKARAKNKSDTYFQKYKGLLEEIKVLALENKDLKYKSKELNGHCHHLDQEVTKLTEENCALKSNFSKVQDELSVSQSECNRLKEIEAKATFLSHEIDRIKFGKQRVEEKLEESLKETKINENKYKEAIFNFKRAERETESVGKDNRHLKRDLKVKYTKIKLLEEEKASLTLNIKQLENDLITAQAQSQVDLVKDLKDQLKTLKNETLKAHQFKDDEIVRLSLELQQKDINEIQLQHKAEIINNRHTVTKQELSVANENIAKSNKIILDLKKKNEQQLALIRNQKTKLTAAQSKIDSLNELISKMKGREDTMKENEKIYKKSVEKDLTVLKNQLSKSETDCENYLKLYNSNQNEINLLREKLNVSESLLSQTKAELEEHRDRVNLCKKEVCDNKQENLHLLHLLHKVAQDPDHLHKLTMYRPRKARRAVWRKTLTKAVKDCYASNQKQQRINETDQLKRENEELRSKLNCRSDESYNELYWTKKKVTTMEDKRKCLEARCEMYYNAFCREKEEKEKCIQDMQELRKLVKKQEGHTFSERAAPNKVEKVNRIPVSDKKERFVSSKVCGGSPKFESFARLPPIKTSKQADCSSNNSNVQKSEKLDRSKQNTNEKPSRKIDTIRRSVQTPLPPIKTSRQVYCDPTNSNIGSKYQVSNSHVSKTPLSSKTDGPNPACKKRLFKR